MAETQTTKIPEEKKAMTAADAAKRVRRPVVEYVDGKNEAGEPIKVAKTKEVPVRADEVLAFKDHDTHVVVVTKDGQKFTDAAE